MPIPLNDPDLKYDIDSRLTQFEDRVKSQLEWYQEELRRLTEANKAANEPKPFIIAAGEIESDDEVDRNQRAYELQRINDLEKKLNAKDNISKDLKVMVEKLEMELDDMRAQMNEKNNAPVPAVIAAAPTSPVAEEKKKGINNHFAPTPPLISSIPFHTLLSTCHIYLIMVMVCSDFIHS